MKEKQLIEEERDNLERQLRAVQNLVNDNAGSVQLNNETLERIKNKYHSPAAREQRTPSAKRNYHLHQDMPPLAEQSAESLLDPSELSFEESFDALENSKRRTSNKQQQQRRSKSRRSHSMGQPEKIIATTTVTMHPNGHTHAQAVVESQFGYGHVQRE